MRRDRYADGQADQAFSSLEKKAFQDQVGRWLVKFLPESDQPRRYMTMSVSLMWTRVSSLASAFIKLKTSGASGL